jgi:hypothetical protein
MKKNLVIIFLFCVFSVGEIIAQIDDSKEESIQNNLSKQNTSSDDAFGILDKGELVNTVGNQGMISDSYYQNLIYNFRWPKSKGVASMTNDVNAIDDLSILFAHKGNVLDSYTRYRAEDWMAPVGALGKYHADDQPSNLLAPDGAPRLAHSDIPITWPKGYFDESKIWHESPSGDFTSLTDEEKQIVLSKGAYYDSEKNVWRFWPGNFRKDIDPESPTFGQQVPGEFAADREVYLICNDQNAQPPSHSMGMTLEMQIYSYGRRFAQDIQIYDIKITNNGTKTLDSCYFGYYTDFQFGDVLEETYGSFNTGINPNGYDNAFYQFDYNGSNPGNVEVGYIGMEILKTPFNLGVTDAHFCRDLTGNITPADDKSIWPVMISDPNSPKLMSAKENYFHGTNVHFDNFSLTAEGQLPGPSNWTLFADSGPFILNPGEHMEATLVVSAGNDLEDLKSNFLVAEKLFQNSFLGPSTPPSPKLHGVAGDNKVTLYWDNSSENAVDLVTKKKDFQGYKIYRSQDQGATWGKQITDSKGNLVGYVPIAQFDKIDLVQGVDPFNNFNYLGDNTGIVHYFVDTDVLNGVNYSYTITAYDSGSASLELESLESAKGTTTADANLIDVTPRSNAIGFEDALYSVNQIAGVGNGSISVEVVDADYLKGDNYLVTFNSTPADTFFLSNENLGSIINSAPLNSSSATITDGFTLSVIGDKSTGVIKDIKNHIDESVFGELHRSSDGSWYVKQVSTNSLADQTTRGSDYEFRFSNKGSFAAGLTGNNKPLLKKYAVPFEVWNVENEGFPVNCILIDKNSNNQVDLGEEIRIINSPYEEKGDTLGKFSLLKWYYNIIIDTVAGIGGRLPLDGESFRIYSHSQLTNNDTFRINILPPKINDDIKILKSELSKVEVVPNPFIVNAAWEQIENNRRIRFMFLPSECTISIYTIRGELVNKLYHNNGTGDEDWNLTNNSGIEIAFGVYLYVVETPEGEKTTGKFAVIK